MKRAFIVAGPESSGNRALATLLINAGCEGGTGFEHPLMHSFPDEQDPVVIIRSYPHGDEWPDLAEMYRVLRGRGYMVRVLIVVRDPYCVIESNVETRHHPRELAWFNYHESYKAIFRQLEEVNVWYSLVPIEGLALNEAAGAALLRSLGLPEVSNPIRDENAKYYSEAPQ